MGFLFAYLAYTSVTDTVWNATTVLLTLVATLDFGVGFRYLRIHFRKNNHENE